MIQEKINRAFPSLVKMRDLNLPVKKARAIYKIYIATEEICSFAASEEKKYLDEFRGTLSNDGTIDFQTPEECASFKEKFEELCHSDVELDIEPVVLTEADLGDQRLTPGDIYNLEGFVIFE